MKTLSLWLFTFFLALSHSAVQAEGFYKWKDARGNIQYGDQPPPKSKAKRVKMPAITVIEDYGEQWKPLDLKDIDALFEPEQKTKKATSGYTSLKFIAPKADQAIRANDGDVSAMLSIKPPLKNGHQIAFYLDGKQVGKGDSRTKNFTNLPRGAHTVSAKILDQKGKVLKSSSVAFNVMRFSKLLNKKEAKK